MTIKTWADTSFRDALSRSLETATGPRRDKLTVLATVLWAESARIASGRRTFYGLEKYYESESFGKNAFGDPYHHNKWSKYIVGLHRPNKDLVNKVERKAPGTANLLGHPLWEILRSEETSFSQVKAWLGQLQPDIQQVGRDCGLLAVAQGHIDQFTCQSKQLHMLERRASIDALACLSLLLLQALNLKRGMEAMDSAHSLYKVLLVISTGFPYTQISRYLFDIIGKHLLSRIIYESKRIALEKIDFDELVFLLNNQRLKLEDAGVISLSRKDTINSSLGLLDGNYGFDVKHAFDFPYAIAPGGDTENYELWRKIELGERLRNWGLDVIRHWRVEKVPPDYLYEFPEPPPT